MKDTILEKWKDMQELLAKVWRDDEQVVWSLETKYLGSMHTLRLETCGGHMPDLQRRITIRIGDSVIHSVTSHNN